MTGTVQHLLGAFEHLKEEEKREFAYEILKQSQQWEWPALKDEDFVLNGEALFLELDQREATHA